MKKCENCQNWNLDDATHCQSCGVELSAGEATAKKEKHFYTGLENKIPKKIRDKLSDFSEGTKAILVLFIIVVSFVLGFGTHYAFGVKASDYKALKNSNAALEEQKVAITEEYNKYKEKMQPYEQQQITDVQSAEEKKRAAEQAQQEAKKKAAEEQAKAKAEQKAAEEQAKAEAEQKVKAAQQEETRKESVSANENNSYTVYITNTGSKYHRAGCQYLKKSKTAISKTKAISQGYTACAKCNP